MASVQTRSQAFQSYAGLATERRRKAMKCACRSLIFRDGPCISGTLICLLSEKMDLFVAKTRKDGNFMMRKLVWMEGQAELYAQRELESTYL